MTKVEDIMQCHHLSTNTDFFLCQAGVFPPKHEGDFCVFLPAGCGGICCRGQRGGDPMYHYFVRQAFLLVVSVSSPEQSQQQHKQGERYTREERASRVQQLATVLLWPQGGGGGGEAHMLPTLHTYCCSLAKEVN